MKHLYTLFICAVIYLVIIYLPVINLIILPVKLLSTFLHEFGHAFFAIITGGSVKSMAVNINGSGVTRISGGNAAILTIGGYLGSALFGNLMLRLSASKNSHIVLKVISALMFISAFLWFDNLLTTAILLVFSTAMWLLANKQRSPYILSFLGTACLIYIIQDFNVGPTSDLQAYERQIGFFPAKVWMYVWLLLVLVMTTFNLYTLSKKRKI